MLPSPVAYRSTPAPLTDRNSTRWPCRCLGSTGTRLAPSFIRRRTASEKGRCVMSLAILLGKSSTQARTLDLRREARKSVRLNASIVTANGIASCELSDLSTGGCRLHLFELLVPHQYLSLKLKLAGSGDSVHIPLAQIRWTKNDIAGVEFVYLSPNTHQRLLSER